jgi:hypothetical protein
MIIARIETFLLRIPIKPGTKSATARDDKNPPAADSLLVKLTTDCWNWTSSSCSSYPRSWWVGGRVFAQRTRERLVSWQRDLTSRTLRFR